MTQLSYNGYYRPEIVVEMYTFLNITKINSYVFKVYKINNIFYRASQIYWYHLIKYYLLNKNVQYLAAYFCATRCSKQFNFGESIILL
jgi:hypothetical protein